MLHIGIFLTILFYLITSLASSTPTQFPPKGNGFTASLIPPISPRSPFYPQILAANNIPTTLTNVTLDRTHYEKWLQTKTNMSQNSYGAVTYNKNAFYYVMDLLIGDPMQLVYALFDTGSDLVWVQCKNNQAGKSKIPYYSYNPSRSRSYNVIDCMDKQQCQTNKRDLSCSTIPGDKSCVYNVRYIDGDSSKGVISSDAITLKPHMLMLQNFVFGCSNENPELLPGIIGASNSVYSLPRQLNPHDPKFSYCISGLTSQVNFVRFGTDAELLGRKVKLLRHRFNPSYYMDVIGVQVNGVDIKVDPSVFALSPDAQTGFVIDSGYDITSLSKVAFNALKDSIQRVLGTPVMYSGYEICYLYSTFGSHWPYKQKPKIGIRFRDGVFELDESNAWRRMSNTNLDCLLMHRTPAPGEKLSVLGNEQLFDVNVGHDPINNLLYLQPMKCPTSF